MTIHQRHNKKIQVQWSYSESQYSACPYSTVITKMSRVLVTNPVYISVFGNFLKTKCEKITVGESHEKAKKSIGSMLVEKQDLNSEKLR